MGGGHSHVHVLKMFGMRPEPGVRLTLVTRDVETPYSGMLPGYVAGFYTRRECHIDLARLAAFAGARLVHAEAVGLDWREKRVLLRGRPAVAYDVLSIDIGITPRGAHEVAAPGALPPITPVKPIDGFCARWDAIVARVRTAAAAATPPGTAGAPPVRIVVVGGGAGGVEASRSRSRRTSRARAARDQTQGGGARRRPAGGRGRARGARRAEHRRRRGHRDLAQRAAAAAPRRARARRLRQDFGGARRPTPVGRGGHVRRRWRGAHGERRGGGGGRGDLVHAGGDAGVAGGNGLELDGGGFIAVQDTLESTNVPSVFAAGDVASVLAHPAAEGGRLRRAPGAAARRQPSAQAARAAARPLRAAAHFPRAHRHRRRRLRRVARQPRARGVLAVGTEGLDRPHVDGELRRAAPEHGRDGNGRRRRRRRRRWRRRRAPRRSRCSRTRRCAAAAAAPRWAARRCRR